MTARLGLCFFVIFGAACSGAGGPEARDLGSSDGAIPSGPQKVVLGGCDARYTVSVTAGATSGMTLSLDTGSTTTGVVAADCTTCPSDSRTPAYVPSTEAVTSKAMVSALYDIGELGWSGTIYDDVFFLAGTAPHVLLQLAAIDSQQNFFDTVSCDTPTGMTPSPTQGIFGVGTDTQLLPGTNSYLDRLAAAGVTDAFALRLCHNGGALWVGGYDPAAFNGAVSWTPSLAQRNGYYVSVTALEIGSATGNMKFGGGGHDIEGNTEALLDSGGALLFTPSAPFATITAAVASFGYFQTNFGSTSFFSASRDASTPVVTLSDSPDVVDAMLPPLVIDFVGGFSISLPASKSYLAWAYDGAGYDYYSNLYVNDLDDPTQHTPYLYLGDTTMLAYVTIFDRANQRIGFATPADACP